MCSCDVNLLGPIPYGCREFQHKDMKDVVAEFPSKSHADVIEFYYNWKFHEPDYSRWQSTKRQIDIILVRPELRRAKLRCCPSLLPLDGVQNESDIPAPSWEGESIMASDKEALTFFDPRPAGPDERS